MIDTDAKEESKKEAPPQAVETKQEAPKKAAAPEAPKKDAPKKAPAPKEAKSAPGSETRVSFLERERLESLTLPPGQDEPNARSHC